jgi:hypothetical protein
MTLVRTRATVIGAAAVALAAVAAVAPTRVTAASAPALNGVSVQTIVVSPAYAHTGVVVAVGTQGYPCKSNCYHMWVSRDRGASWQQAAVGGWKGGSPIMAVDGSGKEHIFTGVSGGVQRSDDLGKSWSDVGAGGNPAVSPSYPSDSLLAVAGTSDYTLKGGSMQTVSGSGGTMSDGYWAVMPGFPSTGSLSPVFLGGVNSTGKATVEHCTSSFSCSGPTVLPVTDAFAGAPLVLPSTTYVHDRTVFAHTAEGVFKSTDGGATFVPVTPPVPGATHVATSQTALSPSYSENGPDRRVWEAVIAVKGTGQGMTVSGDLYSSTDGGTTWKGVGSPGPFDRGATAVAVAPDGRVFAGAGPTVGGGLLCSPDGTTWMGYCPGSSQNTSATSSSSGQQHAGGCTGSACPTGAASTVSGSSTVDSASSSSQGDPNTGLISGPGHNPSGGGGSALRVVLGVIAAILAAGSVVSFVVRRRRQTST